MASIQPSGKKHKVRYKDVTGKHRAKTFDTKTDAKAFLAQAIAAEQRRKTLATHGVDLGPEREDVRVWEWVADEWLPGHAMQEDTREKYASALRAHLQDTPLAELRMTAVAPYDAERLLYGVKSPNTRYTLYQALSMAFDAAKRARILAANPIREVSVPQPRRARKPRVLPEDERAALLAALPAPWNLMAALQLWTGARPGEAIAWRAEDYRPGTGDRRAHLAILQAVDRSGQRKSVKTDNEAGERVLPLSRDLAAQLDEHVRGRSHDALLFPSLAGTPVTRTNFTRRVWSKALDAAADQLDRPGLRDAEWYDLRHTCASDLIARGADVIRVSQWMGHADVRTTLRVYGHMFPTGLSELADLRDPLIERPGPTASSEAA